MSKISFLTPLCLKLGIITTKQHSANGNMNALLASTTFQNVNLNTSDEASTFQLTAGPCPYCCRQVSFVGLHCHSRPRSTSICYAHNYFLALSKFNAWVVSFQSLELKTRRQNVGYEVLRVYCKFHPYFSSWKKISLLNTVYY